MTALRIGLTGGIGCGKSTVAAFFSELGIPVIDADVIARELVEPGEPALAEIVQRFGTNVLTAEGRLDRTRLRAHIFADETQRLALESILHPRIRAELVRRAELATTPYCILCIPLLLETRLQGLVDRVLVVDASEATQISRSSQRDGVAPEQIRAIMQHQVDRATRLAAANDVISNDDGVSRLHAEVLRLHAQYLAIASSD